MDIRRRLWIYLGLLLLALGTMYLLKPSISSKVEPAQNLLPRDYQEVRAEGILRVVAPYALTQGAATTQRSLHQLTQRLSKASGLEVQTLLEDNTHTALELLQQGRADLVLHAVERTTQLDSTSLLWLHELVADPIYLVQRPDSVGRISQQLDLSQSTIVLPRGSSLKLFVEHLAEELGLDVEVQEDSLYNTEQLIMKVHAGSIDYTLCSGEELRRYRPLFPQLDFSVPISHNLRRGWITRRNSPILADSLRLWLQ